MAKAKLTINSITQSNIELTNNNPQITPGTSIDFGLGGTLNIGAQANINTNTITVGQITHANGGNITIGNIGDIEAKNNSNLYVVSNESLDSITATSSTIQLNNNYTGNVRTTVKVGNNGIVSLIGIELPLGTVTLDEDAIFGFTHNNSGMQVNTLNNNINSLSLVIKDIHAVVDTANFLNNKFNNAQGFQGNITEGIAARIYEKNKEAVSLFMKQNNMIYEPTKIESYFNQCYLETSGITHNLNGSDFENLPIELVGEIFSHADYSYVNLA